ncbi:hypothetical protein AVEN_112435-1 [Araneus ventricosus]|uniref:Uncharacterized protein n=1 Tax=Araneus ventricosus TaxID=182803 RepID=A0A4Y2V323_ARAVE|nr:hypothetical protein AVEN_112435-1 [Araneus ventricosus]
MLPIIKVQNHCILGKPRHFEMQSEDDTSAGSSFPNFYTTSAGGRRTHYVRFKVPQTHIHGCSYVRLGLPLGNRGCNEKREKKQTN